MRKQQAHSTNFKKIILGLLLLYVNTMAQLTELRRAIAGRLKQARENAGYPSAQAFCEANQLSYPEYFSCESGSKPIRASKAMAYAKLLNISLRWLLIGKK